MVFVLFPIWHKVYDDIHEAMNILEAIRNCLSVYTAKVKDLASLVVIINNFALGFTYTDFYSILDDYCVSFFVLDPRFDFLSSTHVCDPLCLYSTSNKLRYRICYLYERDV